MIVTLSRSKVRDALKRCNDPQLTAALFLEHPKLQEGGGSQGFNLQHLDPRLIEQILLDLTLSKVVRGQIMMFKMGGTKSILDMPVKTTKEAFNALSTLAVGQKSGRNVPSTARNMEVKLGSRWYPAATSFEIGESYMTGEHFVSITSTMWIGGEQLQFQGHISAHDFKEDDAPELLDGAIPKPKERTARELLAKFDMRPPQFDEAEYLVRCTRAKNLNERTGKVVDAIADGLIRNASFWWRGALEAIAVGSPTQPTECVIDKDLELKENDNYHRNNEVVPPNPFIRVFCMPMKKYVYLDVDDVREHKFDETAVEKLVLPGEIDALMKSLFAVDPESLFGDLLSDKHGGMIICAAGPTGVGKTLTAECFSQHGKRPLYSIALAELGTNVNEMEARLKRIFTRAKRWNAVLLLDEADILFAHRGDDLERAAIVGIFLRLLDYHSGFLFITTNRPESIDEAFAGRITVTVRYPELDDLTRKKIWSNMLTAANISIEGDVPATLREVAEVPLNGRQVRNAVRLLRVLHGNRVTREQLTRVGRLASREVNVKRPTNGTNGKPKHFDDGVHADA